MKTALILISLFFLVQLASAQFTYPLQTGNRWQYKEPPPPETPYVYEDRNLGDTLMPNGLTYSYIYRGGDLAYFFRQEGERIYQFITWGDSVHRNQEIVRLDFSKGPGDTVSLFQLASWDTVTITVTDTGRISIFGTMRPFKAFYWRQGGLYHMDTVVDSLGIAFIQIEPGAEYYLAGAVLNGVIYGTVTSVNQELSTRASGYALFQNYPNPFNPATTIQFALVHPSHVTLTVFNTLGQMVAELVNGEVDAGYHEVKFDAAGLASGVYFYRLQAGSFVDTKKLLHIR